MGFAEGLQVSIDYYDISVDKAIGTRSVVRRLRIVVTRVHWNSASLITRDPVSDDITQIRNVQLNVNNQVLKGYDIEAQYRWDIGSAGALDIRLLGTIIRDLITTDKAPVRSSVQA